MIQLLILLLVIWLVLSVVGLVVKGLFWLFIIGAILFAATAAWGWLKERA